MNILIIGGTRFLGRHLTDAAISRGHAVSLFNRGKTGAAGLPDVERLTGDREHDLDRVRGRAWDAVIDTCGYVPRIVRVACDALADSTAAYVFVSSISVYADESVSNDETGTLHRLADESVEEVTGETYGGLKAACEGEVARAFGARALIVRPGLIVGRHDPTDRFTYWPWRVSLGGEVLVPGRPQRVVQFIDGRDLAAWIVSAVEAGRAGVFNATGPAQPLPMGDLIASCLRVSGSDARIHWADEEFLLKHQVVPWSELPVWVPESDPANAGFNRTNIDKALGAGLAFHPLDDTVRATLDYAAAREPGHVWKAGLSREREAQLLGLLA